MGKIGKKELELFNIDNSFLGMLKIFDSITKDFRSDKFTSTYSIKQDEYNDIEKFTLNKIYNEFISYNYLKKILWLYSHYDQLS